MEYVETAKGDGTRAVTRDVLGADGARALRGQAHEGPGGAAVAGHGGEVRRPADALRHQGERLVRGGEELCAAAAGRAAGD